MSIKVSQTFERTSAQPIDASLTLTKAQMVATNDNLMPDYYFTICQDDGKIYLYDKTATPSATTGKFTEFSGGGSSDVKFFTTTDTLNKEINGTKVVAAADLPGITWSDLVVGSSVIKDAKGTMGLVTAITGTTSVTVTTATTSTPTVELTQAEYDALATKDPDTIYFITDSQPNGGTCMGAYDTIYSTTEHVVGSFMGKPLYQKTLVQVLPTIEDTGTQVVFSGTPTDVDMLISAEGTGHYASPMAHCALANQWMNNYRDVNTTIIVPNTTNGNFVMQLRSTNPNLSGQTYYITMRYTKTTDTTSPVGYASPNDYSTSEKIVGTWIDGKPLYQKTLTLDYPTVTADGTVAFNNITDLGLGIDKVISCSGVGYDPTGTSPIMYYLSPLYISNAKLLQRINFDKDHNDRVSLTSETTATNGFKCDITVQYTKTS